MDRETHIANLIALAKTDGRVDPHEFIFIQSMALKMGMDGAAFQRIVKYPDLVPQRMATTREGKLHQLAELIVLASMAQQKSDEELSFINKWAVKMGFYEADVAKLSAHLSAKGMPENAAGLEDALKN